MRLKPAEQRRREASRTLYAALIAELHMPSPEHEFARELAQLTFELEASEDADTPCSTSGVIVRLVRLS